MTAPALLHNVGMPTGTFVNVRPPVLPGRAFRYGGWPPGGKPTVRAATAEAIADAIAEAGIPDRVGVVVLSYPGDAVSVYPGPAIHGLAQRISGPLYLPHRPFADAPTRRYDSFVVVFPEDWR